MAFEVTAIYALPLALLGLILWVRVTLMRASLKVSIGDVGHPALHERIRQHGNFVEWAPWVVLLMALAEGNGAGDPWLHASVALLLVGRLIHSLGLKAGNAAHLARYIGNTASLLALLIVMGCLLVTTFGV